MISFLTLSFIHSKYLFNQRLKLRPLQWHLGFLTTGPAGEYPESILKVLIYHVADVILDIGEWQ